MRASLRLLGVLAVLVLAGCVTPALDHGAYLENAKSALRSAASETASARLAVRALLDERSTNAYADTVVTDSEKALAPIEASFGGVDPPGPDEDALRSSTVERLGAASDALSAARIAVRHHDEAALAEADGQLSDALDELEQAIEDLG